MSRPLDPDAEARRAKQMCPVHPTSWAGPFGDSCVWCSGQSPAVRGSFMHRQDRESLSEQLGVGVADRNDFEKLQRQNPNIAVVESGSDEAKARKALKEWSRQPAVTRGPVPEACRPNARKNPVNAVDGHKILARIRKQKADERRKQSDE